MRTMLSVFLTLACLALSHPLVHAQEKLLGLKMDEAKKQDFFTFFHLQQTGTDTDAQKHTVLTFKPMAEQFRKLVTVTVTLDKDARIHNMQLALARSFIDHRTDGIFARDIAKSLLRSALPDPDQQKVADLINEIEFGFSGTMLLGRKPPKLPDPPTKGYQTFLGKQDAFDQDLERTKLEIRHVKGEKEAGTLFIAVKRQN